MALKIITREQINTFNAMNEALKGTEQYNLFYTMHEYLNGTRWYYLGWSRGIRSSYLERSNEQFYLKCIKGQWYVYWESLTEKERFLLNDVSKAFFGIEKKEGS